MFYQEHNYIAVRFFYYIQPGL